MVIGVDLKRVPPKSRPTVSAQGKPYPESGPQGLRRPRFSFFRFTCQTARDFKAPSPVDRRAVEAKAPDLESDAFHRVFSEELRRRAITPTSSVGAPCSRYIGFGFSPCQHFDSRNRHGEDACIFHRNSSLIDDCTRFLAGWDFATSMRAFPRCGETLTPHCGHIPRAFLRARVGVPPRASPSKTTVRYYRH